MSGLNNYTLGRGKIYFAEFFPGTTTPRGFRYIGNSPELNVNTTQRSVEVLDDLGAGLEVVDSHVVGVARKLTFSTDNISLENCRLLFAASIGVEDVAAGPVVNEPLVGVELDRYYPIGASADTPLGVRGLSALVVKNAAGTVTYGEGTDYELEPTSELLYLPDSSSIPVGSEIRLSYTRSAYSVETLTADLSAITGALRYVSDNPAGRDFDYLFPSVSLSSRTDMRLKGDEWQKIDLEAVVKVIPGKSAMYVNGRPV